MTREAPTATVVRVLESLNRGDRAALEAQPGLRAAAALLRRPGAALPEGRATIATLVAEGEWVAARLLGRGIASGRVGTRPRSRSRCWPWSGSSAAGS